MRQNDKDGKPIIWMVVPIAYPFDCDHDKRFFPGYINSILDAHERATAAAKYELDNGVFAPEEICEYKVEQLEVKFIVE